MKPRVPLQVSPKFRDKLLDLQKQFKENGQPRSLRDLTGDIIDLGAFDKIEKDLKDVKLDLKMRMDRRRRSWKN